MRAFVVCLAALAVCAPAAPAPCDRRFLGTWEYRQAAGAGFDAEGERLEFACKDGSMRGLYFGLERAEEHGLFYTLVEMQNLTVAPDGALSFLVGERELFSERPRTFDDIRLKKVTWSGVTRDTLVMRGRIERGNLYLTCTSTAHLCPDKVMMFRKGKW
jgi:hypothetical protein